MASSSSAQSAPKPQPHLFATPVVREIPRPVEPGWAPGTW